MPKLQKLKVNLNLTIHLKIKKIDSLLTYVRP